MAHKVTVYMPAGGGSLDPLTHEVRVDGISGQLSCSALPRSASRLVRLLDAVLGFLMPSFPRAALTLGRTVYFPDHWSLAMVLAVMPHELVHVDQGRRHGVWLLWLTYVLGVPLPAGLAWFRYRWEREAFLVGDVMTGRRSVESCVDALCSSLYLWPWPRRWVSEWFARQTTGARRSGGT